MTDSIRITTDDLRKQLAAGKQFTFIDTRNPQAWAESDVKIPGAIRVLPSELDQHLSEIPKDRPIVTYCTGPHEASSASLAQKLRDLGYTDVWALEGGLDAWRRANLPLEQKSRAA